MEQLLTPQEVSEKLGVKLATIYKWTHLGFIPFIKVGRLIRFREDVINEWLDKKSQKGKSAKELSKKISGSFHGQKRRGNCAKKTENS